MMEKTENTQIDKSKAIEKKDILIPKAQERFLVSEEIQKSKRELTAKLREAQPGYIHFTEICRLPDPEDYEPDDEDLAFLKRIFPKELKSLGFQVQVPPNPIVSDFAKLMKYIELTRDLGCSNARLGSHKFTQDLIDKVVDHWKYKTAKSKYPLLRKFWKNNIMKTEFGELDPLRVAFREREKERMRLRKTLKLTEQEILEKLEQMKTEADIALVEARLILKREQLKNIALQISLNRESLSFTLSSIKTEFMPKATELVQKADEIIQEYNPPALPPPEPRPKEPVSVEQPALPVIQAPVKAADNDIACFISSLISELYFYGFELSDFKSDNIKGLNEKIRKLKRSTNLSAANSLERTLFFGPSPPKISKPEPETLVLFKAISYSNPHDVYIEKMSEEQFREPDSSNYKRENFVYDYLIKRDVDYFRTSCSMFRVPFSSGQNPFIFCNTNSYSSNNAYLESLKVSTYNKIFGNSTIGVDLLENSLFPYQRSIGEGSLGQAAERHLSDMKFESRFKSFLNAKRVK